MNSGIFGFAQMLIVFLPMLLVGATVIYVLVLANRLVNAQCKIANALANIEKKYTAGGA